MDPSHLPRALQNTLSPSAQERQEAEQFLAQCETVPGYVVALLKVITNTEVLVPLRQSAAITLKQLIKKRWVGKEKLQGLSEEDKAMIKNSIVELIIHLPPLVRSQVAVSLKFILEKDYPERWDGLVPKIMSFVRPQELGSLHGALYTLRILVKKYEFKPVEGGGREPLHQIVDATFPTLLQLFEALCKNTTQNADLAVLQKLICKIFWSCTQSSLPPLLRNGQALAPWMTLLFHLLQAPVPQGEPVDLDDRKNWPPWKVKKWVAHIFNRFFGRYGSPRKSDDPETQRFSEVFRNVYAPKLLQAVLQLLTAIPNGSYLPLRVIAVCLNFVGNAIKVSSTYKILKPHLPTFLTRILFPLFCFNDEDQQTWEEDPAEFIHKEYDVVEDFWDPRMTGINMVLDLMKSRGSEFLHILVKHIVDVLQRYQAQTEGKNMREKDGALSLLGHLCGKVRKVPQYWSSIENMMATHVLPEFSSSVPFMRARACWIFGQFFDAPYNNPQVFLNGLQAVVHLLKDKELPVRFKAAVSLRYLCQAPLAKEPLRSILPQLLEVYFSLMAEIESEDLVKSLEMIIAKFGKDIAPYALALTQRLCQNFLRLADADEDDDNSAIAAVECLGAIQTILDSVSKLPDLYQQLEPILMPVLVKLMDHESFEFFDEALKILSYMTYYSHGISQNMWSLFPLLYRAFDGWAVDYMDQMIVPLDNYISRGTDVFLGGENYLQMTLAMYKRLMDKGIGDMDSGEGAKLIEVILQHCRGRVDGCLPGIIELAVGRLFSKETTMNSLRVLLLEVIANCLYYNPMLTLRILEERNFTRPVFEAWFQNANNFTRQRDKKLAVIGLSSLMSVPLNNLSAPLIQVYPKLLALCLKFLHLLQMQRDEFGEEGASGSEGEEDHQDDDDEEDSDEEDIIPDDEDVEPDITTLHQLSAAASEHSWTFKGDADELVDEAIYTSPLDDIDEIVFFVQQLQGIQGREGDGAYQQLIGALSGEERTFLTAVTQKAIATIQQKQQKQQTTNSSS